MGQVIKARVMLFSVFLIGCALDAPPSGEESSVDQADTVCGVPQLCQPNACVGTSDGGIYCTDNPIADQVCQSACGTPYARCLPVFPLARCEDQCTLIFGGGVGYNTCVATCLNDATTTCVLGLEP